ncbi:hypothetical protein KP509_14G035300 [Ceratopteris richardii]|uniref:Remorin C-terminal domain-containing protein n=1 Tax=Ceratopteris richardii TaxID=49495 RepID=A0A8T2T8X2_CERRI|nr:hypothetical protein KP509_14G035300 [Ceratopteris richardii]
MAVSSTGMLSAFASRTGSRYPIRGSHTNRVGDALEMVNREETNSYIDAWEMKKIAKVNNSFDKAATKVHAWENAKKAEIDSNMRQSIEKLERKRARILEKAKNEIAQIHKEAREKVARAEAKRKADFLRIDEEAAAYRSHGLRPAKKLFWF